MGTLLNENQVAEMIGLTVHWLRRKRWAGGGIPFIKIAENGAVRYRQEDIEKFVNARIQSSTSDVRRGYIRRDGVRRIRQAVSCQEAEKPC